MLSARGRGGHVTSSGTIWFCVHAGPCHIQNETQAPATVPTLPDANRVVAQNTLCELSDRGGTVWLILAQADVAGFASLTGLERRSNSPQARLRHLAFATTRTARSCLLSSLAALPAHLPAWREHPCTHIHPLMAKWDSRTLQRTCRSGHTWSRFAQQLVAANGLRMSV